VSDFILFFNLWCFWSFNWSF